MCTASQCPPVSTSVHQCPPGPPISHLRTYDTYVEHNIIQLSVECFQFLTSPTPWTLSLTPCRLLNDIDDVDSSKGSAFCQELLWLASTHERLCVPWPLSEHGNGCWKLLKIVEICWVHTGPQLAKKVQSLEIPEIWIWNHSEIILKSSELGKFGCFQYGSVCFGEVFKEKVSTQQISDWPCINLLEVWKGSGDLLLWGRQKSLGRHTSRGHHRWFLKNLDRRIKWLSETER